MSYGIVTWITSMPQKPAWFLQKIPQGKRISRSGSTESHNFLLLCKVLSLTLYFQYLAKDLQLVYKWFGRTIQWKSISNENEFPLLLLFCRNGKAIRRTLKHKVHLSHNLIILAVIAQLFIFWNFVLFLFLKSPRGPIWGILSFYLHNKVIPCGWQPWLIPLSTHG